MKKKRNILLFVIILLVITLTGTLILNRNKIHRRVVTNVELVNVKATKPKIIKNISVKIYASGIDDSTFKKYLQNTIDFKLTYLKEKITFNDGTTETDDNFAGLRNYQAVHHRIEDAYISDRAHKELRVTVKDYNYIGQVVKTETKQFTVFNSDIKKGDIVFFKRDFEGIYSVTLSNGRYNVDLSNTSQWINNGKQNPTDINVIGGIRKIEYNYNLRFNKENKLYIFKNNLK